MNPPYALCCDDDWFTPEQKLVKARIEVDAKGCWMWKSTLDALGYGRIGVRGQSRSAHRLSYMSFRGEIPKGLVLDHLCRIPSCVNPWHLEAVTQQVNALRGVGHAAINAKKTHCHKGHPLSGANLKFQPGGRACRECARISNRTFQWRRFLSETSGGAS